MHFAERLEDTPVSFCDSVIQATFFLQFDTLLLLVFILKVLQI